MTLVFKVPISNAVIPTAEREKMYLEDKYKGWLSSLIKLENSGLEDVVFYGHTEKICGYSEIAFL